MLLNKMELKRQKDKLALYNKSLPSLKKKQSLLQKQIIIMESEIRVMESEINDIHAKVGEWADVFAEGIKMPDISVKELEYTEVNIAGIDLRYIKKAECFAEYSKKETPWWMDDAASVMTGILELSLKIDNILWNIEIIKKELETTNQRINLFEKRLIPETTENIRKIRIFLGDQQVAAVCRGKITKNKKEAREGAT